MESTRRINWIRQIVPFDDSVLFDLKQRTFNTSISWCFKQSEWFATSE